MKYIKPYNEKKSTLSDVQYMLLPISDDLQTDIGFWNNGVGIDISGSLGESNYKVFSIDDYLDDIERIIDYLESIGYSFIDYVIYETKVDKEIINLDLDVVLSKKGTDIRDIHGKRCIYLTLMFPDFISVNN